MLELTPVSLKKANDFVNLFHRPHKAVTGHKFSIGCSENGRLVMKKTVFGRVTIAIGE